MHYRRLGRSGIRVSPLCLGAMMFGGPTDAPTSARIIAKARDAGINFLDTANAYSMGASEEIVGRSIATDRDAWVLATKVAQPMGKGIHDRGLSRKHIWQSVDASLRRLGTDYIDILYLHREDIGTPLEETVMALGDLTRQGKIRYVGLSNFRAWRMAEICAISDRLGVGRPVVCQPYYNLLNRQPEVEVLPCCHHFGLGVAPYSPFARGVLSGKYRPGAEPATGSRAGRKDKRILETEMRTESFTIAETIIAHCRQRGLTPVQFAINWVLNNALITAPIVGPRTEEQMDDYLLVLDAPFTAEDEALVDRLVTTGHASTPGYNDPLYPIEGRVPRTGPGA
ncbi:MAG: aldo/keto reductase [Alphaproteobacteria bacterium]